MNTKLSEADSEGKGPDLGSNTLRQHRHVLPSLQRLLRFLDLLNLEVVAEHIVGVDISITCKLSCISPDGDYSLRQGQLVRLQQQLQVQIGADMFASRWSRQHPRPLGRNASSSLGADSILVPRAGADSNPGRLGLERVLVPWSNFSMPLLHPPLPLLPRILQRVLQEKMQAIIVASHWLRAPCSDG
jgi:hypothetical protein